MGMNSYSNCFPTKNTLYFIYKTDGVVLSHTTWRPVIASESIFLHNHFITCMIFVFVPIFTIYTFSDLCVFLQI